MRYFLAEWTSLNWKRPDSDITFVKNSAGNVYKVIWRQGKVSTEAPKVE
jgi:hypothetical protein